EIAEVQRLLRAFPLVTLTGTGGCGKTRLALEAVRPLLAAYPDGIWLVELAPLADPELVPQSIVSALGIEVDRGQPLPPTLVDYLRQRQALLVLDNCEHLIEACARLTDLLLRSCPTLHILATSREALGLSGEIPWRVPSLPTPDPRSPPEEIRPERLRQYD